MPSYPHPFTTCPEISSPSQPTQQSLAQLSQPPCTVYPNISTRWGFSRAPSLHDLLTVHICSRLSHPRRLTRALFLANRASASKIDPKIQRGLFLFAVSNSCINPIVYGELEVRFASPNTAISRHIIIRSVHDQERTVRRKIRNKGTQACNPLYVVP